MVVVIQRVRVVWRQDERGAAHADLRRGVPEVLHLPDALPDGPVVVHEIVADSADGYRLSERVLSGDRAAANVALELTPAEGGVTVRTTQTHAAYPYDQPRRLFTVPAGQVALYRANFRVCGCTCATRWWYEDWTVRVANAPARPGLFTERAPQQIADHRVHLYGGHARRRTT
ncbi:hypothetical protein GCM10009679_39900 [Saccharothrix algeriensis]|uniref:Uncharacterized protein n=1 Tax=Catellatospora bangladeshensis TaxID=310355 RepID=A0A8J3JQ05_9ACTN|nr:hypothetical protein Cba03nite_25080 [Catellatospora bangladeshensis]